MSASDLEMWTRKDKSNMPQSPEVADCQKQLTFVYENHRISASWYGPLEVIWFPTSLHHHQIMSSLKRIRFLIPQIISVGNLFQCLIALVVKFVFLTSNWNFSCCNLHYSLFSFH